MPSDIKFRIKLMFEFIKVKRVFCLDDVTFNDFYLKETVRLGFDDKQLLEGLAYIIKKYVVDRTHNPEDEWFLRKMMPEYDISDGRQ